MSEIDRIYEEREKRRAQAEAVRRQLRERATTFLAEFYEQDVKPSKTLAEHGIEASLADNRLLMHRSAAGIHADPFQIMVGTEGEIDAGGRSLGAYTPEHKAKTRAELTNEILSFFDL